MTTAPNSRRPFGALVSESQLAFAWSFVSQVTPIFSAALCSMRVLVPVAYFSATAVTGGAVDALVAFDRVLREETTSVELGEVQRQRADEGGGAALPAAVLAFRPAAARPVGLRVHRGVRNLLSESANQCLHVDDVVVEPGHGEHIRRRV